MWERHQGIPAKQMGSHDDTAAHCAAAARRSRGGACSDRRSSAPRGLTQTFAGVGGDQKMLDGLDLDMRRGDVTAIMGPSGAGKSTLLYALITR